MKAIARSVRVAAPLVLGLLGACAAPEQTTCRSGEKSSVNDVLYFGTQKPGGLVSPDEWREFLELEVTPRFPSGLTTWQADGQWLSSNSSLVHESSYVVNLLHADDVASERAIREIIAEYKTRFHQEAVLRVKAPACTSL